MKKQFYWILMSFLIVASLNMIGVRAQTTSDAKVDDEIAGWAALTAVSGRCVYAGVGEVSVYVAEKFWRRKIGNALLQELIKQSEQNNIWTLQAGIFPENKGSIKIHEANGFRTVGYREKIGQMDGNWRDTILMERRSSTIGIK